MKFPTLCLGNLFCKSGDFRLAKNSRPDDRPPFNIRDPRYREYNANKSVIEKELAWFGKQCIGADDR